MSKVQEPVQGAVRWLRELVLESAPELREELKMGIPTYKGKADVCYIADYTQHANLGFHRGALIRDTQGILEGTGRGLRHVKVRRRDKGLEGKLTTLIRDAIAIDEG